MLLILYKYKLLTTAQKEKPLKKKYKLLTKSHLFSLIWHVPFFNRKKSANVHFYTLVIGVASL